MESTLFYLTSVIVVGISAQWLAWRLRIPAILMLLGVGFLAGRFAEPERFIERELLFPIISLSVAVILFEGGLSLRLRDLRETATGVVRLCTVAVVIAWFLGTVAALLVFESVGLAALAGAIYVVTGPTVIIPLLRHVRPTRRVGSVVKWEGIVNDPIGALLAVLVFEMVIAQGIEDAAIGVVFSLLRTIALSTVIGLLAAGFLIQLMKHHWIPDYLHNPALFAIVLGSFTTANLLQAESGLATVTLLGVILANQKSVKIEHLIVFKENLSVLLISTLFILLASRLTLQDLTALGWQGLLFLALLILIVRPASVYFSTMGTPLTWAERSFVAWLAPRGIIAAAVSSVFALEMSHQADLGIIDADLAAQADQLVPLTFLVIVGTVTIYGLLASPLARWLGIADQNPQGILFAGADRFARTLASVLQDEGFQVRLVDTNHEHVSAARMTGLSARHASILSEYVQEDLDLGGIGRLMAMTGNDEVNALACIQFMEVFGRANVYQLAPKAIDSTRLESVAERLTGRILFDEEATYEQLEQRVALGAAIKKTTLSPEFTYDDFRELYGETATVLCIIRSSRELIIRSPDKKQTYEAGQTLICLVDPSETDQNGNQD